MRFPKFPVAPVRASSALLVCALAMFTASAVAGEPVVFTLTNGTEAVITEFYASPPSTADWEEDILGVDVLEPGDSIDITIDDGREDCGYDFLAVFEDGSTLEHDAISVCGGESYIYQ